MSENFSIESTPANQCPITSMSSNDVANFLYDQLDEDSKNTFDLAVNLLPQNVAYACSKSDQSARSCFIGRILPNFDKNYSAVGGNEVFRFFAEHASGNLISEGRLSFLKNSPEKDKFVNLLDIISKELLVKFFPHLKSQTENSNSNFSVVQKWPMNITEGIDGDTYRIILLLGGEECDPLKLSLRFSGIDTPESKVVGKFSPQLEALVNTYSKEFGLNENDKPFLRSILKKRMLYLGLLPSLISKEFLSFVKENSQDLDNAFLLEESFIRYTKQDSPLCNKPEIFDFYGRILGTILVKKEDLIARFIEERLPLVMASREANELYSEAVALTPDERKWIKDLENKQGFLNKAISFIMGNKSGDIGNLLEIVNPKNMPKPRNMFSPDVCKNMAQKWIQFNKIAQRANDYNASLPLMGAAWVYPKYRNHNAETYINIRSIAVSSSFGLWSDPVFRMLDPMENGLDKNSGKFTTPNWPPDCVTGEK